MKIGDMVQVMTVAPGVDPYYLGVQRRITKINGDMVRLEGSHHKFPVWTLRVAQGGVMSAKNQLLVELRDAEPGDFRGILERYTVYKSNSLTLYERVVDKLTKHPGLTLSALQNALRPHSKQEVRKAVQVLLKSAKLYKYTERNKARYRVNSVDINATLNEALRA